MTQTRTALITGASQGIGKATALELAKQGIKVIGCARSPSGISAFRKEIKSLKLDIEMVRCDVSQSKEVRDLTRKIQKENGCLDILINNAGGFDTFGGFNDLTQQDWKSSYQLNVLSVVLITQAFLPLLKKSIDACIVNVSSISGIRPGQYLPHYSAAKAALINLTQSLAIELAKDKIRVNVIAPGPVLTQAWEKNTASYAKEHRVSLARANELLQERQKNKIPLGRIGTPEEVAQVIQFLSSPASAWMTGVCLPFDGGMSRTT